MVSEFQFINHIKKRFSLSRVGDDCAVLPKDDVSDLLITADLLIEDIDFRLEWTAPEGLGHKALAVSLSDIAAMGGTPRSGLLSIGVPKQLWNSDFVDKFYDGWHKLARRSGVELVGGDISRSPDKLVIDSIVLGEVHKGKSILRSGAQPGDAIYVSGTLGGAAGGLRLLEAGASSDLATINESALVNRQLRPMPQVDLAKQLMELDILKSMIDLSDGLSSDLQHICDASGVGAKLDLALIPVNPNLRKIVQYDEALEIALNGGEDFELLFTVTGADALGLDGLPVTRIGTISSETGTLEIVRDGAVEPLESSGFKHF